MSRKTAGSPETCRTFYSQFEVTVSHTPVRNGIEHFVVGGKGQGVEDASVYIWIGVREEIRCVRSSYFVSIRLAVGERPAVWETTAATG